jgi:energy-coupling factor transporter transmembrane protein EcfT
MNDIWRHFDVGEPDAALVLLFLFAVMVIVVVALLMTILVVWLLCRIFKKAGYCWAWGLLWLVPIGNIIVLLMLAFGDWPIHKEMRRLKEQSVGGGSNATAV